MIVIYIFLLLSSLLFYILYEPVFSFYLFSFLLIMPIVLFIMTLHSKRHLSIGFSTVRNTAGRGAKLPLMLKIENRSRLPITELVIEIEYQCALDKTKNRLKINTPVLPRETQYMMMNISAQHYGNVNVRIKKARVCDMLKLFKLKMRLGKMDKRDLECTFTILPDSLTIENPISNYSDMGLESNEYSKHHPGDDPSEIFDIREYADGDKISRIHWKLSAKADKTMVKEYSMPIANSIIIMLDLSFDRLESGSESKFRAMMERMFLAPANSGATDLSDIKLEKGSGLSLYDTVVETAAAISEHLILNETPHRIIWYDIENDCLTDLSIGDEEGSRLSIKMLLETEPYEDSDLTLKRAANTGDIQKCGHLIYISPRYSEGVTELMSSAELAYRYTYLPAVPKDTEPAPVEDEFAQVVPVVAEAVTGSIEDLLL